MGIVIKSCSNLSLGHGEIASPQIAGIVNSNTIFASIINHKNCRKREIQESLEKSFYDTQMTNYKNLKKSEHIGTKRYNDPGVVDSEIYGFNLPYYGGETHIE